MLLRDSIVVLILLLAICMADNSILSLYTEINRHYDSIRPPLRVHMQGVTPTPVKSSNYHSKRCAYSEPGSAIQGFKTGSFSKFVDGQVSLPFLFNLISSSMHILK